MARVRYLAGLRAEEGPALAVQCPHRRKEPPFTCVAAVHMELRATECLVFRGNNNEDA